MLRKVSGCVVGKRPSNLAKFHISVLFRNFSSSATVSSVHISKYHQNYQKDVSHIAGVDGPESCDDSLNDTEIESFDVDGVPKFLKTFNHDQKAFKETELLKRLDKAIEIVQKQLMDIKLPRLLPMFISKLRESTNVTASGRVFEKSLHLLNYLCNHSNDPSTVSLKNITKFQTTDTIHGKFTFCLYASVLC